MKIFDCFMYFDEDLVLDLRLNYLSKFVDNFVIVESKFNHKGEERKLEFDLNRFVKFKDKITYIILDKNPEGIEKIKDNDSEIEKNNKLIILHCVSSYPLEPKDCNFKKFYYNFLNLFINEKQRAKNLKK